MSTFYTLSVYCNNCHRQLNRVNIRGAVYLHHQPVDGCDNSEKYFFPPAVALDEAYVPCPEKT